MVLKDFPEYKVAVDGHTDNVPITGALMARFPTNKELSEARAVSAAKALADGGRANATTTGYGDTKPVEPNTTAAGRAKNRRVEVRVTKEERRNPDILLFHQLLPAIQPGAGLHAVAGETNERIASHGWKR